MRLARPPSRSAVARDAECCSLMPRLTPAGLERLCKPRSAPPPDLGAKPGSYRPGAGTPPGPGVGLPPVATTLAPADDGGAGTSPGGGEGIGAAPPGRVTEAPLWIAGPVAVLLTLPLAAGPPAVAPVALPVVVPAAAVLADALDGAPP